MKKITTIFIIALITTSVYAQQRDTTKHKETEHHRMNRFIRQRLNVDSVKAEQIGAIQAEYKTGIHQVAASGLSEEQKRRAVDSLVRIKNTRLATILTPEQQGKFIPSTERKKNNSPVKQ